MEFIQTPQGGIGLTFRKSTSLDVITDTLVVLHTETKIVLIDTNYKQELSKAFEEMIRKADIFE